MRIGYPCINRSLGCTSNSTFRLRNYTQERMEETVRRNLACLRRILDYNSGKGFLFFRISSDVIPLASHPVCDFDWEGFFKKELRGIGGFIRREGMRISMHPDQFTLLNSPNEDVTERSIRELGYHCRLLDAMRLGLDAKIQIHVGGAYGDKQRAAERFAKRYSCLGKGLRSRLVIENDERLFGFSDCMMIHERTGIPLLFDSFHNESFGGFGTREAMEMAMGTWKRRDGPLMVDYSSQERGSRQGTHAKSIDIRHFRGFLRQAEGLDFDLMLEIKDKEESAGKALALLRKMRGV